MNRPSRIIIAASVIAIGLLPLPAEAFAPLANRWNEYIERENLHTAAREYPFDNCFTAASSIHKLPKTLLLAVARGESNFDPRAVSSANARGLMQIRWPLTAKHLGITSKQKLFDPCTSVEAGARYINELLGRFDGDMHTALVAYNQGPTKVAKILKRGRGLSEKQSWYSQYIYDHLLTVLEGEVEKPSERFVVSGQVTVITFEIPLRARALVEKLKRDAPGYRFEWRKRDVTTFDVNFLYDTEQEREGGERILRNKGILPP